MAASSTEILREYLLAIGFKIDASSSKKFDLAMAGFDARIISLAKGVIGVQTAITGMVGVFTYQMEKLYYASLRTKAAAGNIEALEYGGRQIGLAAGTMTQALEGMASAIRMNPGVAALIEGFGVQVKGRDTSDVARDMLNVLQRMPHWMGANFATMIFGMDEQTFTMIMQQQRELERAAERRKKWAQDAGIDTDAAAKAGRDYANSLGEMWEKITLLKDLIAVEFLPLFKELTKEVNQGFDTLVKWIKEMASIPSMKERLLKFAKESVFNTNDPFDRAARWALDKFYGGQSVGVTSGASSTAPMLSPEAAKARVAALSEKYALGGLLDGVWNAESARGTQRGIRGPMTRRGQAKGPFQFMDGTASDYNIDPDDFGQSSGAAAEFLSRLLKKYKGSAALAAAAYNWGPGNVDAYLLGQRTMPDETLGYVKKATGITLEAHTNIQVHGTDPHATARAVADAQRDVNADIIRDLTTKVQ